MTHTPRFNRSLLAFAVAICLAAVHPWTAATWKAAATTEPGAERVDTPLPAVDKGDLRGISVTLLTGDRVSFGTAVGGEPQVFFHPRDPATSSGFSVQRDGGSIFVIPSDVASQVPGVLARELFDVTALARMGYDDASRATLPLIVEHRGTARALAEATPLRVTGQLHSIDATAVSLDKERAVEFGRALASIDPARRTSGARAIGGAHKIWLDGQVTGSALDSYLTSIGAPAAWNVGLDGSGVRIAVLDTGVDAGHPALSGRLLSPQRDFTGTAPGGGDDNGHGTHVASLALGTGAGSGGSRQGVAPEADLLAGKVLRADSKGQESWVIAGMEWAAASGADVVNLSLGAVPSGQGDPLAEALERLTAQHDVLFTVAAGNRGGFADNPFTINSPGVAPSALTVAAVRPDGDQAGFSSEGPTSGTYGLKPDIAAPGVGILGARAGGRDGDLYTSMSGTSMATPIVAGAAALLREQHPDWSAAQIKAALVGTTDGANWQGVWKQGSGRLDLAAATSAELRTDVTSFDFGHLEHPDNAVRTREVTLTNTGDEAVTVHAEDVLTSHTWHTAADRAVTVEPGTLRIPPHASATATLTVDPEQLEDVMWQGVVTFTENGEDLLRIPVGLNDEPPRYDLHLSALDSNGDPWDPTTGMGEPNVVGNIVAYNADTGGTYELWPDAKGQASARVDPGHYSIFARVVTPASGEQPQIMTLTGTAELLVDADTSHVLDARAGVPLEVPRVAGTDVEMAEPVVVTYRRQRAGEWPTALTNGVVFTPQQIAAGQARVTPTEPVTTGSFEATARWQLTPGGHAARHRHERYDLVQHQPILSRDLTPNLSRRDVRRLARVEQVVHPVAREGRELLTTKSATQETPVGVAVAEPVTRPVRRTVLMTANPEVTWQHCLEVEVNNWRDFCGSTRSFDTGSRTKVEIGGAIHASPNQADREPTLLRVNMGLSDGEHHSNVSDLDLVASSSLRISTPDGRVQAADGTFGSFAIPEGQVRLRLEQKWTMADLLHASKRTRTVWDFTAVPPDLSEEGSTTPPLLTIDYGPKLTGGGIVKARGSTTFALSFGRFAGLTPNKEELSRIAKAWFWWSADQGETWHRTRIRRRGPLDFRARLTGPKWRSGDDLSVRVRAVDSDGNSIDQTNIGLVEVRR